MRTIHRDIVGAFIFSNDGQVLLGKNGKGGVYEDLWVIPGGGIEAGETKMQALIREVAEETGLDIRGAKITEIDLPLTGKSQKTLKETGETVMVEMIFYNFKIDFDLPASALVVRLEEDLSEAVWTPFAALADKPLSISVRQTLEYLGLL